jgi:hypothetical protein
MLEVYELKVYRIGNQEISEDTTIYLEAWYEAVKDRYETFDEFIKDAGRERMRPYYKDKKRSEIITRFLEEHQKSGIYELTIPAKLFSELEAMAEEKGQTVSELVSGIVLENTKPN